MTEIIESSQHYREALARYRALADLQASLMSLTAAASANTALADSDKVLGGTQDDLADIRYERKQLAQAMAEWEENEAYA